MSCDKVYTVSQRIVSALNTQVCTIYPSPTDYPCYFKQQKQYSLKNQFYFRQMKLKWHLKSKQKWKLQHAYQQS